MEHKHPSVGSAGGGEEEANYRRGGGERGGTPARRPITPRVAATLICSSEGTDGRQQLAGGDGGGA